MTYGCSSRWCACSTGRGTSVRLRAHGFNAPAGAQQSKPLGCRAPARLAQVAQLHGVLACLQSGIEVRRQVLTATERWGWFPAVSEETLAYRGDAAIGRALYLVPGSTSRPPSRADPIIQV